MTFCREVKARKAKYGFDLGSLGLHNVVEIGKFVEILRNKFDDTRYIIEESGWASSGVIKVYTEIDEIADFIRIYTP